MNILVTGGCGNIGRQLVPFLQAGGHLVRVLDLQPAPTDWRGIEARQGDIRNASHRAWALQGMDVMVHLAAESRMTPGADYTTYVGTNVVASLALGRLAARQDVRMVAASSVRAQGEGTYQYDEGLEPGHALRVQPPPRVVGDLEEARWDARYHGTRLLSPILGLENEPGVPNSAYAASKRDMEVGLKHLESHELTSTCLRFTALYGPGIRSGPVWFFLNCLKRGDPPPLYEDGLGLRLPLYVDDALKAIVAAVEQNEAGVFNIAGNRVQSMHQLSERVAKAYGTPELCGQTGRRFRLGEPRHALVNTQAAYQRLGFAPSVSLDQGIAATVRWFKDHA